MTEKEVVSDYQVLPQRGVRRKRAPSDEEEKKEGGSLNLPEPFCARESQDAEAETFNEDISFPCDCSSSSPSDFSFSPLVSLPSSSSTPLCSSSSSSSTSSSLSPCSSSSFSGSGTQTVSEVFSALRDAKIKEQNRKKEADSSDTSGYNGDQEEDEDEDEKEADKVFLPGLPPVVRGKENFEYLDHTADIQVHSWGVNIEEAFENAVLGMFDYMTDRSTIDIDEDCTFDCQVSAHDMESLLFAFMDEFLYHFHAEFVVLKELHITKFDHKEFKISARGWGETFSLEKHPQGTEVKAITFSNMQIWEDANKTDVFVIIDI